LNRNNNKINNNFSDFKLSNFHISIFYCDELESVNGTILVEQIRDQFENVYIQGISTEAIFGLHHVVEALKITLESLKRGIMAANRPELDLLLRISCTTQISKAISHAGIKSGNRVCFVMFSKNKGNLLKARHFALRSLPEYDSLEFTVEPSARNKLATNLGFEANSYFLEDDEDFLKYLVERAALITK
jgi:tRNA threonylcarbamoyladenosine modification (KEOPS) complex Cgi121 subunit